jgi:hypothetical protein
MAISKRLAAGDIISSGLASGFLGGTLMMAAWLVQSSTAGAGRWLPVKLVAGVFYGVDALIGDTGVIALGMVTHYAVAMALGMLFSALLYRIGSLWTSLALGILFGLGVWAFMTWLILPWANDVMLNRVRLIGPWWLAWHALFGIGLGLTPLFRRRVVPARLATAPVPPPVPRI